MQSRLAISVGSFDGVHLGHRDLIARARSAVGPDGTVVAVAFDPHPRTVLARGRAPGRLTRFDDRSTWLRAAGADEVEALGPTPELLRMDPPAFVEDLVRRHRPAVIVEGPDFRFGAGRAGSVETLRSLESRHGYRTIVIDPVTVDLTNQHVVRVSSTFVRWLLSRGRVGDAARLLGRPPQLVGEVVVGDRRGRSIGVPTANLDCGDLLLPANGVYAGVAVRPDGTRYPAAVNVGPRPTFDRPEPACEAHLIGYDGAVDDYGWTLRISLHAWLRDLVRFDGPTALRAQLDRDIARAARRVARPTEGAAT